MKKLYVSVAVASALAVSASAVEVTPFGHLGAFYHQGFGGLPTTVDNKQRAYADVSARVGLEVGLGSAFAIGIGGWGAYPFYSQGKTGDIAIPKNGDVSDAYFRYDGGHLRFVVGRFDIGEFYMGKDRKNYTGVDWIYGNTQGAALNVDGGKIGLWAYWRNSQLGAGQAFNRLGYELSSFNTYQNLKKASGIGELASVGLDFNFGAVKISPFASYLTDTYTKGNIKEDVLNAGAKAQLEFGGSGLRSITTLRAVFGMNNLMGDGKSYNGLTFWADEELRFNDFWKLGVGYIGQSGDRPNLLNFGDRTRFYGYRGGMSGAFGAWQSYGNSTYYVFGGIDSRRINLDLLYAGGDYKELSAVVAFKLWEQNQMHLQVGAGYVGTEKGYLIGGDKWQHSALAFAKFGF